LDYSLPIQPQIPPDSCSEEEIIDDYNNSSDNYSSLDSPENVDPRYIENNNNQIRTNEKKLAYTQDVIVNQKSPNWGILAILDVLGIPVEQLRRRIRPILQDYRTSVNILYLISYAEIFTDNFYDRILHIPDNSVAVLHLCNVIYEGKLIKEKYSWIKMKES